MIIRIRITVNLTRVTLTIYFSLMVRMICSPRIIWSSQISTRIIRSKELLDKRHFRGIINRILKKIKANISNNHNRNKALKKCKEVIRSQRCKIKDFNILWPAIKKNM